MKRTVLFLLCAGSLAATVSLDRGAAISGLASPGSTMQLPGDFTAAADLIATLFQLHGGSSGTTVKAELSDDKKTVSIKLPPSLDPGTYYLALKDNQSEINVPGTVTVQRNAAKLIAVHPGTLYSSGNGFDFDLVGENFSMNVEEDDVWLDGQGTIVKSRALKRQDCKQTPCLWVENPNLMHIVGYKSEPYQGPAVVSVKVADGTFTDKRELVLARYSGAQVFLASAVVTGLLFYLVVLIVQGGLKGNKAGNRKLNLLQSFILDPETNSYSLSKFQLFMFSASFVFGYLYVLLARWLVQWNFGLPDVPTQLSGLLGISAGTSVASAGLTAANGSKGAGLQHPTGADLIASGGVVVAERFQFFVWTIIACLGFLALLISQNPATIKEFPTFPDGLLYIMGVSAAGYLGGKAVRKPGPVIQNLAIDTSGSCPVLIVRGQNLATDGSFLIDGRELPIVPPSQREAGAPEKLLTFTPQDGASNLATELKITILQAAQVDLTGGDHRFRIVNRDGQFADSVFTANPPIVTKVVSVANDNLPDGSKTLAPSSTSTDVIVRGKGLSLGSQVTWKAPGTTDDKPVTANSNSIDDALQVALVPGPVGSGLLTVVTPSGFRALANVAVETTPNVPTSPPPPAEPKPPAPEPPQQQAPAPQEQPASSSTAPGADTSGVASTHIAPATGATGEGQPGTSAPASGPSGEETPPAEGETKAQ